MKSKRKAKRQQGQQFVTYRTRHLPTDLHMRMRLLAVRRGTTVETVHQEALAAGLSKLESA